MHLFPKCFAFGNILIIVIAVISCSLWWLLPILLYVIALFTESFVKNRSLHVAYLSVVCSYIQMFCYGFGFVEEMINRKASKQSAEELYRP